MKLASLALAASVAVVAQPALALDVGYTLVISGNTNVPDFQLTNDSDAAQITRFRFTIGDVSYNFDYVANFSYTPPGGFSASIITGDINNSGVRTDEFELGYVGFDPTETFRMQTDVDPDSGNLTVNFNSIFWNNGEADSSFMEVTFSTGEVLSQFAGDQTVASSYTFQQSSTSAVPVPAALPLLGGGLAVAGLLLRRARG
ncbi:VPLPA-CTERM sorting domain-containing protein [Albimonas sp. CAU 1670]|uniref:VPLPA-CTERM sorting domain-containing protein n=1 Tax=Albimonas sp. CAU 1670 TaxID=3032599 RepID=UPI0023DCD5BC|nr:VPLPA-CTERM sorting domain-containing protein [Albimonas sp. CAU 1670]MDF2234934.1 VPLPA-CTERM sorting domain-containing protein [Albimonas sp. CAU 1670]